MSEDKYQVVLVPVGDCSVIWKDVKGLLKPAIDASGGRWQPEYVLVALVSGRQRLWIALDAEDKITGAMTTEISFYPEKRMFAIHFLGGEDFDGWFNKMLAGITEFAIANQCAGIECSARKGFWKWFKDEDFKQTSVFYELEL
jgi:hypothetical protein